MSKRVAIYAGSFDPFTNGHEEIVQRGLTLFDELIILVAISPSKVPFLKIEDRVTMISKLYEKNPKVKVDSYNGLLVDYAQKNHIGFILRGLRPTGDFDYEFQMASMNKELSSKIETIFLMTQKEYHCLSSSAIREVLVSGGDIKRFVPEIIADFLKDKRLLCISVQK